MTPGTSDLPPVLEHSPVRVVFGPGKLDELGGLARDEGASRVLLVTDPGLEAAGHPQRARRALEDAGLSVTVFDGVKENPTTAQVRTGLEIARRANADFFVAVGGGSSMDCAKAINLLLTNGRQVADYWGIGKASKAMLPFIAVPTTAGTGSEAQSFALISDEHTHRKMACGDKRPPLEGGLRPRAAILDPDLTRTQPASVAAATGIDAVAHAIETAATKARNAISRQMSVEAWRLLEASFEAVVRDPQDDRARSCMLLGAHVAGAAIEQCMLGAAHACANPLTSRFGLVHGVAVGIMLPHVVRYNGSFGANPYADLGDIASLAGIIERFLATAGLPTTLMSCGIPEGSLAELAADAAEQWTAGFNPVTVESAELLELYQRAYR